MGHVSWQESLAFIEAARDMGYSRRIIVNHVQSHIIAMPLDAMRRAAEMGAFLETCWNALAPGRMDSPELVHQFREVGLPQIIASTDYFRPYSPNPVELFRMFLGMLHEGGLSKDEVKQVACTNPAKVMGLE
jgi:predicted metal-dependent TIM-barrel fold hydrolase